jgi:hypothetical protein
MKVALIVMAVLGLAALVAALMPVRVRMTLKGRGQFGDTWVIAGGLECLKFTISIAAAHATDRILQVHFFGKRLLVKRFAPATAAAVDHDLSHVIESIRKAGKVLDKRFDREQLLSFVLGLRRYVRLETLRGNLTYCTPDVALTGMLSGVLYAIAGLASPIGQMSVVPEWEDVARANGDIDAVIRLSPGRAAAAVAWFVVNNIRLRESSDVGAQAQARALPAQS